MVRGGPEGQGAGQDNLESTHYKLQNWGLARVSESAPDFSFSG